MFLDLSDDFDPVEDIKNTLRDLLAASKQLPPSRETSLMSTKIEEALLWAGQIKGGEG